MAQEEKRFGRALGNVIAWMGFALMVGSFIWWQMIPAPTATTSKHDRGTPAPFTLVVLDPGHGGQDSGAMCGGILEKDLTLDIAQRVDRLLQAQGLATLMTRVGDSYVSLADRAALANRARDCIFVSIHFNEGGKKVTSGIETYYAEHQAAPAPRLVSWIPFVDGAAAESPALASQSLAGFIQEAMVARTKGIDRGTKPQQFFVIANVQVPAALVEAGFLSNNEDMVKLGNSDYREQMAAAISEGITRYRDVLKERQLPLAATNPKTE
jgi:N-acetylmuramoyl-L-alanine amidase